MASSEGTRHRAAVHVWVRWLTVVLGAAGVCFGTWGYRSFPQPLPWPDAIYGGVQLLALNPTEPPEGVAAPSLLVAGWFLSAAALASAGALLAVRLSLRGRDRWSARRAANHRVIIGDGQLAAGMAVASADPSAGWAKAVLVADMDDTSAEVLRRAGVCVVTRNDRCLTEAMRNAKQVVVAEADDVTTLAVAFRAHELAKTDLRKRRPRRAGHAAHEVTVVVQSPSFARTLLLDESLELTVISLQSEGARALVHWADSGFTDHIVVVGDGAVAEEVAAEAVLRWLMHSRPLRVRLAPVGDRGWADRAAERVRAAAPLAHVEVVESDSGSPDFADRPPTTPSAAHAVFVAGLDQVTALNTAMQLRDQFKPGDAIVALLGEAGQVPAGRSDEGKPSTYFCTWADLLRSPSVAAGVRQRLALAIINKTSEKSTLAQILRLGQTEERERTERLVEHLITALRADDIELRPFDRPGESVAALDDWPSSRVRLTRQLDRACRADDDPTFAALTGDVWRPLLTDLPGIAASLRLKLCRRAQGGTKMELNAEQVEQLARAIHQQYCATWNASRAELGVDPTASAIAHLVWEELTHDQQEASRQQARRISEKLESLYLVMRPLTTPGARRLVLETEVVDDGDQVVVLPDTRIESLARQEHDQWMDRKKLAGWTQGEYDEAKRVHNLLVEYDRLSPAQQRLDSDPVRNLPSLLRLIDMGVVPV